MNPHQFSARSFLHAIPGLAEQFSREVPSKFFDGGPWRSVIAVNCACGSYVRLHSISECGCGRFFVYAQGALHEAPRVRCAFPEAG